MSSLPASSSAAPELPPPITKRYPIQLIHLIANIAYWAWIVTETLAAILLRTRSAGGKLQDRGTLYLLWAVIAASITCGDWYGGTHPHTIAHGAPSVITTAVTVFVFGLVIRWIAILTLGKAFSVNVAIRTEQTLQQSGIFRLVRHPSYTGLVLIFFAIGLFTRNWIGLAIVVLPTLAALIYRMHVEEQALIQAYGKQYTDYMRTTKRLIPGIY